NTRSHLYPTYSLSYCTFFFPVSPPTSTLFPYTTLFRSRFGRCTDHERLQGPVGHRRRRARGDRLPSEHPRGQRDRTAVAHVLDPLADHLDLGEGLADQGGEVVRADQNRQRLEGHRTGGHDHPVHLTHPGEEPSDRGGVGDVDGDRRGA